MSYIDKNTIVYYKNLLLKGNLTVEGSLSGASGNEGEVQYNSGGNFAANAQGKYHPTEEAWTYGYREGIVGQGSIVTGGTSITGNEASGSQSSVNGGVGNKSTGSQSSNNGGSSNTSSGSWSSNNGGESNIASGNHSSNNGGNANKSSAQYSSTTGGIQGVAYLYGQQARAQGAFAAPGDAQYSNLVVRNQTTDATTLELFLNGSNQRLEIPNNTTWLYKIRLIARRTDADGENAGWLFEGIIKKDGTAGSTAITLDSDSKAPMVATTWDANVSANTVDGGVLKINVTGEAAKTINWVAKIELVEVGG